MLTFLENAGELRFIILRRKKRKETPVTTHTTPLQNKSTYTPVTTKKRPRLDVLQATELQGEGEAGKPRKIAPEPPPQPKADSPLKQNPKHHPS